MTDNPEGQKFFRRRRKFQGATWTPEASSALTTDGVWCPQHRMRHGYKSKALGATYEKGSNGKWKVLWFCSSTGDVLEELELGKDVHGL